MLKLRKKGSEVQIAEKRDKTENYIITKFTKKGFHSLTTQELAVVIISQISLPGLKLRLPSIAILSIKSTPLQKVNQNNFHVHSITKASPQQNQFPIFFLLPKKGNLAKIMQFAQK
jgi:hypothetical protein